MKRIKFKRVLPALLITLLSVHSLAGCGTASTPASNPSSSQQEKLELIFQGTETPPPYQAEQNGKHVDSSIYAGKVAVITVGTTWCPDCQKEYEILEKLQKEFDPSQVIFLTTIAVDGKKQTQEAAETYFSEHHLTLPLYFAENAVIRETYQISYIPTTFIVGLDGKCVSIGKDSNGDPKYYFVESLDEAGMRQAIQQGLNQK